MKKKHVCETETQNKITREKKKNNGGKQMKSDKSMNENIKEWTNKHIDRKVFFIQKMGGILFTKMSKR